MSRVLGEQLLCEAGTVNTDEDNEKENESSCQPQCRQEHLAP